MLRAEILGFGVAFLIVHLNVQWHAYVGDADRIVSLMELFVVCIIVTAPHSSSSNRLVNNRNQNEQRMK